MNKAQDELKSVSMWGGPDMSLQICLAPSLAIWYPVANSVKEGMVVG